MLAKLYFRRQQQVGLVPSSDEAAFHVAPRQVHDEYTPIDDKDDNFLDNRAHREEYSGTEQSYDKESHANYEEPSSSSAFPAEYSEASSRSYVTSREILQMHRQLDTPMSGNSPYSQTPSRPSLTNRSPLLHASVMLEETPIETRQVPPAASAAAQPAETARVLRFSSRESHRIANSIHAALQETLNDKSSSNLSPITEEYLLAKRHLFLETLFTDGHKSLLPSRFDMNLSGDALCAGVERTHGHSFTKVMNTLAELWERLQ